MSKPSYVHYGDSQPADPEPDPRVVAMMRVVDLEKQRDSAQREADERQMAADEHQKKAAIVGDELSEARDVLNGLLGLPSRSAQKSVGINVVNGYGR